MKIGIDLRPTQTEQSRQRGVGSYVHNQVAALLETTQQDEILLFYAPELEAPALLESARPASHWHAIPLALPAWLPSAPDGFISLRDDLVGSSAMQAALSAYNLDVFHVTHPFEWEVAVGPNFNVCPMVATLYDLILLVFAPLYLAPAGPEFRELYLRRLQLLEGAKQLVAISDASRRDAIELLGLPSQRIDVVWADADECFKPLADQARLQATRDKFGLPASYILAVLGYHYTKNIEGAITAYSHLPAALRQASPLVIVCRLGDVERRLLERHAESCGVGGQLVLAGEVRQDELVALYNGAAVFFYPSRYDGFGLPVLEAMRCGTPVVSSTSSSLPEVAGGAALLGDPEDHHGLAALLASALTDHELRQQLRHKGLAQAQRFSWQLAAQKTLQAYHRAADAPSPPVVLSRTRLKVAYWSPLNPCPSGISDYSEHLLPHLAQHVDLDLFVDGYAPASEAIVDQFAIYDYRAYPALHARRRYDLSLYQVGNSPLHAYMYRVLLAEPGVMVLHDYFLQALVWSMTELCGRRDQYLDEIAYSEGECARDQAAQAPRTQIGDWYSYPLNRRAVEASLGVIVHSQWLQSRLTERGCCQPITVVPQGADILQIGAEHKALLRARLGLDPGALVIGCFGYIAPVKRIQTVIQAFCRLHTVCPRSALLLVGGADDTLDAYLGEASSFLGDGLRVTGYVTAHEFERYLQISDVCINLRYPTAGETSSTLCRALGAGLPVLTSDLPQFAEFPGDCVWKVSVDGREEDELVAYLLELAFQPGLRRQMGQNAQDYISHHATWPQVAARYAAFLEQIVETR